ncbi:transposase [Kitasatospora sp. NBC_01287]|uniref:transposase n=1 Tax=Kitasatospora sp. NBC_01287 TaxID=2903573 RepID=UPI0022523124|nr:transposase [Kitasatospora sp. NBC_01287]MCX4745674.1 transposase [Kitasatospora sp. NBC_01287]
MALRYSRCERTLAFRLVAAASNAASALAVEAPSRRASSSEASSEAEQLQVHHTALLGAAASGSTAHRTLAALDEPAVSFHPLACWCANTQESLSMLLRPGNAGSNTVADHITVLTAALRQIPGSSAAKILVRIDGAGATHDLLAHLEVLNTARRTVRYLVGWTITEDDEKAIAKLPERAWEASLRQSGEVQEGYSVAELTGLNTRPGWPVGMRLLVRRVRPAGRHLKKLTDFEKRTGWKYSVIATNVRHMWGIAGSHQPQWLDTLARAHAVVEDRVRVDKAMGLRNLPSKSWEINRGWMLAANLGHDLDCWVRLLALHDQGDLERAEPDTMRYRPCRNKAVNSSTSNNSGEGHGRPWRLMKIWNMIILFRWWARALSARLVDFSAIPRSRLPTFFSGP